jgi:hypothetical protein
VERLTQTEKVPSDRLGATRSTPGVRLRPFVALDSTHPHLNRRQIPDTIMGQQLNKYIKRKRRAAYLKRRKERAKAAGKKK